MAYLKLFIMLVLTVIWVMPFAPFISEGAPKEFRAKEQPDFHAMDFPAHVETLIFKKEESLKDMSSGPIDYQYGKIDAANSLTWGRWTVSFGKDAPSATLTFHKELLSGRILQADVLFSNLNCKNPATGPWVCRLRLVFNHMTRQWLRCALEIPNPPSIETYRFNVNCPTEFMLK